MQRRRFIAVRDQENRVRAQSFVLRPHDVLRDATQWHGTCSAFRGACNASIECMRIVESKTHEGEQG